MKAPRGRNRWRAYDWTYPLPRGGRRPIPEAVRDWQRPLDQVDDLARDQAGGRSDAPDLAEQGPACGIRTQGREIQGKSGGGHPQPQDPAGEQPALRFGDIANTGFAEPRARARAGAEKPNLQSQNVNLASRKISDPAGPAPKGSRATKVPPR